MTNPWWNDPNNVRTLPAYARGPMDMRQVASAYGYPQQQPIPSWTQQQTPTTIYINGAGQSPPPPQQQPGGNVGSNVAGQAGQVAGMAASKYLTGQATSALGGGATTTGGTAGAPASSGLATAAPYVAGGVMMYKGAEDIAKNGYKGGTKDWDKDPIGKLGRAQLMVYTGGLAPLMMKYGPLGKKLGKALQGDRTRVNEQRWKALEDQGFTVPQGAYDNVKDPNAWYDSRLSPNYIGNVEGQWKNNAFAMSRDVRDLHGTDLQGYPVWWEKFGKDWDKASLETRTEIGNEALRRGLVDEHHGTIDVGEDKAFDDLAKQMLAAQGQKKPDRRRRR